MQQCRQSWIMIHIKEVAWWALIAVVSFNDWQQNKSVKREQHEQSWRNIKVLNQSMWRLPPSTKQCINMKHEQPCELESLLSYDCLMLEWLSVTFQNNQENKHISPWTKWNMFCAFVSHAYPQQSRTHDTWCFGENGFPAKNKLQNKPKWLNINTQCLQKTTTKNCGNVYDDTPTRKP